MRRQATPQSRTPLSSFISSERKRLLQALYGIFLKMIVKAPLSTDFQPELATTDITRTLQPEVLAHFISDIDPSRNTQGRRYSRQIPHIQLLSTVTEEAMPPSIRIHIKVFGNSFQQRSSFDSSRTDFK